jgi:hypothetical protein
MLSWKAFLVALPVALAGGWAMVDGGVRLSSVRAEMARQDAAGRAEGESYMKTLKGAHADRQIEAFDRRRALALDLARARRDQLLGLMALVAAVLLALAISVVRRIGREIGEEHGRFDGSTGHPP